MFIQEHEKLNELSSDINNLKKNIVNEDYENSISIIDSLFEKQEKFQEQRNLQTDQMTYIH